MSSIETIKKELKTQKAKIQEKGGNVAVKNDYPSPAEISAGIESIETPNFSLATATESDVMAGKTFFSTSSELKTGTGLFQADLINHLFMYNTSEQATEDVVYYTCPQGLKTIRTYQFYYNYNPICFTFNSDLVNISDFAFQNAINMTFEGFNEMTSLKSIGQYAFNNTSGKNMNFASLPNSVTTIGGYSFLNVFNEEYSNYRFPDSVTSVGSCAFRQNTRRVANGLDLSNYRLTSLSNYVFQSIAFNSDCVIPEGVKNVNSYFNYKGCFKNIYLPSTITKIDNYCFGADSADAVSNYFLKTVTFTKETPPTVGNNVFALQNIENGFKIYVPDNAIEAYKAVANLQNYINCIYPVSQKE